MSAVSEIDLQLPRPITALHQIEITSHCNLRCVYCTSPNLGREKLHMERSVYERALEWAVHFLDNPYQGYPVHELNLAGIGESTIHPDFVEYVRLAREAVGPLPLVLATNGVAVTEALVRAVAPYNPRVFVSLHRPEKAGPAVEALKRYGLLAGVGCDASLAAIDWAGQVDWHVSAPEMECSWIRQGWAIALADGRISTCCLDASGAGVIGHVDNEPGSLSLKPYKLCSTCNSQIAVAGYTQYPDRASSLPVIR